MRAKREALHMTQKWVAEAAKVSERTVMRAEKDNDLTDDMLLSICAVLGLDASDLPKPRKAEPSIVEDASTAATGSEDAGTRRTLGSTLTNAFRKWPFRLAAHATCALAIGTAATWIFHTGYLEGDRAAFWHQVDIADSHNTISTAYLVNNLIASIGNPEKTIEAYGAIRRRTVLVHACEPGSRYSGDPEACRQLETRIVASPSTNGWTTIVVGPITQQAYAALATLLTPDPEVVLDTAWTSTRQDPLPDVLRIDPRGVTAKYLPAIDDSLSNDPVEGFLHMSVRRGEIVR